MLIRIKERLKVQSIVEEIQIYQKNLKEHVERMQAKGLPKSARKETPTTGKTKWSLWQEKTERLVLGRKLKNHRPNNPINTG